jgi:hypothetical protein
MRYAITLVFDTAEPLSREELDVLLFSAELLATEPVGDDGDHAGWSGSVASLVLGETGPGDLVDMCVDCGTYVLVSALADLTRPGVDPAMVYVCGACVNREG